MGGGHALSLIVNVNRLSAWFESRDVRFFCCKPTTRYGLHVDRR